jgi:hypothetical protein
LMEPRDEERWCWRRAGDSAQALAIHPHIMLGSADGLMNVAVASRCGVGPHTVARWRRRLLEHRLEGLVDDPRPGSSC